jgi:serine/threonine-protein kinase
MVSDKGGMGVVQEVYDHNLMRSLVRKAVWPHQALDGSANGRLIEEAQITSQLDHPNIVPVHELAEDDEGRLFYTMKLVRGRDLAEVLDEQDPRTRGEAQLFKLLQAFLKVCDAVSFAHDRGVIHRDLKPDNIMLGEFGETYVMDWGIALLLDAERRSGRDREMPSLYRRHYSIEDEEGYAVGTPGYMAPEQARGKSSEVDQRTDVFCLGAILYEILTGEPPYQAETADELIDMAAVGRVKPPQEVVDADLPPRLCAITMKAMARSRRGRQQSVAELRDEVEAFIQSGWKLDERVFPAGSEIVREGEIGNEAYIIRRGRCRAFRAGPSGEVLLREMGPGDVFGETAALTDERRSASVEAVDDVTVAVVSRQYLREEMGLAATLGRFVSVLAERFRERDGRVAELEREMARASLRAEVLAAMLRSGAGGQESPAAKWSEVETELGAREGRPGSELVDLVRDLGDFVIDLEQDRIRFV